jgi:hypothetical protein
MIKPLLPGCPNYFGNSTAADISGKTHMDSGSGVASVIIATVLGRNGLNCF